MVAVMSNPYNNNNSKSGDFAKILNVVSKKNSQFYGGGVLFSTIAGGKLYDFPSGVIQQVGGS